MQNFILFIFLVIGLYFFTSFAGPKMVRSNQKDKTEEVTCAHQFINLSDI